MINLEHWSFLIFIFCNETREFEPVGIFYVIEHLARFLSKSPVFMTLDIGKKFRAWWFLVCSYFKPIFHADFNALCRILICGLLLELLRYLSELVNAGTTPLTVFPMWFHYSIVKAPKNLCPIHPTDISMAHKLVNYSCIYLSLWDRKLKG